MADLSDLAGEREEEFREAALSTFRSRTRRFGESATHCKSCDEPIPIERREAVITDRCAFCASQIEGKK